LSGYEEHRRRRSRAPLERSTNLRRSAQQGAILGDGSVIEANPHQAGYPLTTRAGMTRSDPLSINLQIPTKSPADSEMMSPGVPR